MDVERWRWLITLLVGGGEEGMPPAGMCIHDFFPEFPICEIGLVGGGRKGSLLENRGAVCVNSFSPFSNCRSYA